MNESELFRRVLQASYCMDYNDYKHVFNLEDEQYAKEKFNKMKRDFLAWYCDLDSANAKKFVSWVKNPITYPCAMIDRDGLVVLFHKKNEGIVIQTDGTYDVGHCCSWTSNIQWTPFKGQIVLEF